MRTTSVFVYEHIAGGGLADEALPSLLCVEGLAMLSAVVHDLAAIDGVRVTASIDARLADQRLAADQLEIVEPGRTGLVLAEQAPKHDRVLLIAPETDGTLLRLTRRLEEDGVATFGPKAETVAICSDKIETARRLSAKGVPTIPTQIMTTSPRDVPDSAFPAVVKPRDGAGSESTFRVNDEAELAVALQRIGGADNNREVIRQPYCSGTSASVSMFVGSGEYVALLPGRQHLSEDGRFRYLGGSFPLPAPLGDRAGALASRAVESIDGLRGYIGVDLLLGPAEDASEDRVVEINPRLTTSYVGLRAMTQQNLAQAWLRTCEGTPVSAPEWRSQTLTFSCDGQVWLT